MTAAPRILFVGHDASRSGAPILLLHFLKWFKANVGWSFDVLLCAGGPLQSDYQAVASSVVALDEGSYAKKGRGRKILRRLGKESWSEPRHLRAVRSRLASRYDLIYVNSVASAMAMPVLAALDCPLLSHVHELDYVFRHMVDPAAAQALLDRSTRFVACAQAVADYLSAKRGVVPSRIDVVHEFVDAEAAPSTPNANRTEMGLSAEDLLIGGAGKIGWRKGTDLFVQIARHVHHLQPSSPIHFAWLGGGGDHLLSRAQLEYDVRRLGLEARFHFLGETSDASRFFDAIDLFTLPSREDPFPLVCLEAAMAGRPIVCFKDAGGIPEFVENDCGFVVPYMDVGMFADRLAQLADDEGLRRKMADAAWRKVQDRHTVEVAAPKLFQSIRATLESKPSPAGRGQGEGGR